MAKSLISVDTKQFDELMIQFNTFPKEVGKASRYAINRTIDFVMAESVRQITKRYSIKAGDVRSFLKPIRANSNDGKAGVRAVGHTLSMAHFPFTPKSSGSKSKVKVTIIKGSKKSLGKTAFVAGTGAKSAEKTQFNVFMRIPGEKVLMQKGRYKGKMRERLVIPRTLSVPQMLGNDGVAERIQAAAVEKLEQRLNHEIGRVFDRMDTVARR